MTRVGTSFIFFFQTFLLEGFRAEKPPPHTHLPLPSRCCTPLRGFRRSKYSGEVLADWTRAGRLSASADSFPHWEAKAAKPAPFLQLQGSGRRFWVPMTKNRLGPPPAHTCASFCAVRALRVTRISHEKVLRCRDLAETSQTLSARIPVSQSVFRLHLSQPSQICLLYNPKTLQIRDKRS